VISTCIRSPKPVDTAIAGEFEGDLSVAGRRKNGVRIVRSEFPSMAEPYADNSRLGCRQPDKPAIVSIFDAAIQALGRWHRSHGRPARVKWQESQCAWQEKKS
jgi:hypothetical protein